MNHARRARYSIGEVLGLLVEEFPDVTISKIRFLEAQGLIEPERAPSGYRKFSDHDLDRLRFVMREQREHYLPLKVIKDRLDAVDATNPGLPRPTPAGASWATVAGSAPSVAAAIHHDRPPVATSTDDRLLAPDTSAERSTAVGPSTGAANASPESARSTHGSGRSEAEVQAAVVSDRLNADARADAVSDADADGPSKAEDPRDALTAAVGAGTTGESPAHVDEPPATVTEVPTALTAAQLAALAGAELLLIDELMAFGLIAPQRSGDGATFDASALGVVRLAVRFVGFGVEARHLRTWRLNADKEIALFEQLAEPLLRQRNPKAREQAAALVLELAELGAQLRRTLVAEALRPFTGPDSP